MILSFMMPLCVSVNSVPQVLNVETEAQFMHIDSVIPNWKENLRAARITGFYSRVSLI